MISGKEIEVFLRVSRFFITALRGGQGKAKRDGNARRVRVRPAEGCARAES